MIAVTVHELAGFAKVARRRPSPDHPQRSPPVEVPVVRDQRRCVDGERAGGLDGVGEFQAGGGAEAGGGFGDVGVQGDEAPGFQDGAIATGEGFVAGTQWSSQHLGEGDGGDGEADAAGGVGFEERAEARAELGVGFEVVDDRGGVEERQGAVGEALRPAIRRGGWPVWRWRRRSRTRGCCLQGM